MAIEHKIPVVPITFFDCKEHFSWDFFSGYPGNLNVQVHPIIETGVLKIEDSRDLRDRTRQIILKDLKEKGIR